MGAGNFSEEHIRKMLNLDNSNEQKTNIKRAEFSPLQPVNVSDAMEELIFLKDIKVDLEVELGNSELTLGEILELNNDSILTLDKMAGDTVDLYINKQWLASGEIVVINEEYGVRVSSFNKDKELPEKQG